MTWNWQQPDWPEFTYDDKALAALEDTFFHRAGILLGTLKHMGQDDQSELRVDLISMEAIKTSQIEGEILNRDSVQSSIRRNFGLDTDNRRIGPAERGIAEMMVDLHRTFDKRLSHAKLFAWHKMLSSGRTDLTDIGRYRTHASPMQVVSGAIHDPKVHFEAPPSATMKSEMDRFLTWFNATAPTGEKPLPPLTRAGIAHLYFVCIHPFEDGNGRIGRAIAEKTLSQGLGQPALLALSHTIEKGRKAYYRNLESSNKVLEITDWLITFAETVLDAQAYAQQLIDFLIEKTKFYDRLSGQLNPRQEKVLARMFREGPEGFRGGLSAENYIRITETSRATATRDLQDLVEKGALKRTGERRHTRYWLPMTGQYAAQ
ncbi:MAG: Fic family protein [Alphaproteobacteria bacterium]|nr:Fic family protein [Alphaproteobacteria bacterium]